MTFYSDYYHIYGGLPNDKTPVLGWFQPKTGCNYGINLVVDTRMEFDR
jgi:hypothetical protein